MIDGLAAAPPPTLWPLSGIGADGPYLVIAPPGNPRIRLDARLLDRVTLIGRSPVSAIVMGAGAVVGAAAAAAGLLFGGGVLGVGLAVVGIDRGLEARRRVRNRDLLLTLGDLDVALHVADGPVAAASLANRLSPFARDAPITSAEAHEDARRRLLASVEGRADAEARRGLVGALQVGADDVTVVDGSLCVGAVRFDLAAVRDYALRGANLPLPGGRLLQAALGLLVVAADERARAGEDAPALAKRIHAYEAWSGRSAGR